MLCFVALRYKNKMVAAHFYNIKICSIFAANQISNQLRGQKVPSFYSLNLCEKKFYNHQSAIQKVLVMILVRCYGIDGKNLIIHNLKILPYKKNHKIIAIIASRVIKTRTPNKQFFILPEEGDLFLLPAPNEITMQKTKRRNSKIIKVSIFPNIYI